MTSAREAAETLLLLRLVKDAITDEIDGQKDAAAPLFDEGDKKTASRDGVPLGKVEMRPQPPKVTVTDRPALVAWAQAKHPALVQPVEDLTPLTEAIKVAQDDPDALTADQFRLIVTAAYAHLGQRVRDRPRGAVLYPAAEKALLDNIGANKGVRVDGATGEAEEVPGVTYEPVPPKLFVTPDTKAGAPELVRSLLTTGMPPLPAIEAS